MRRTYDAMHEMLAQALYSANIGGTPRQQEATKWMHDVRAGDLVVEVSTRARSDKDGLRMGILVREFDEPIFDENGEQHATGRRWEIDVGERLVTWHDAQFVRVPQSNHQRELMEGLGEPCEVLPCGDCRRVDWSHQASRRKYTLG